MLKYLTGSRQGSAPKGSSSKSPIPLLAMVPILVRGPIPKRPFVPPDLVILDANPPGDDNPGAPAAPPGPAPSKKGKKLISAYDGNRTWKAKNSVEFPWA
jgi:hypothetical protein